MQIDAWSLQNTALFTVDRFWDTSPQMTRGLCQADQKAPPGILKCFQDRFQGKHSQCSDITIHVHRVAIQALEQQVQEPV